ncbi:MAG TPA: hypothetical protein VF604_07275 [Pyrinomonadaceae bacterium]|jgi:hypothetical protein
MRIFTEITPEINKFLVCDYQKTNWNFNYKLSAFGFCSGISVGIFGVALSSITPFFGALTRLNYIGFILLFSAFGLLIGGAHYSDKIDEDKKADRRRRYEDAFKI